MRCVCIGLDLGGNIAAVIGSMIMRRRAWIATLLMSVLAFAQVATAAHACVILNPSSHPPAQIAQLDQAMPADCADMAKQAGSTVNVCESHCFAGHPVTAQADAPVAVAAPQLPLTVRVVDPFVAVPALVSAPWAISAAPPPLLRFGRLLI